MVYSVSMSWNQGKRWWW